MSQYLIFESTHQHNHPIRLKFVEINVLIDINIIIFSFLICFRDGNAGFNPDDCTPSGMNDVWRVAVINQTFFLKKKYIRIYSIFKSFSILIQIRFRNITQSTRINLEVYVLLVEPWEALLPNYASFQLPYLNLLQDYSPQPGQ